tara:strand:- start:1212 stop:2330 length:1119 start_codon:yes stop_codon:yes gene_type:complete
MALMNDLIGRQSTPKHAAWAILDRISDPVVTFDAVTFRVCYFNQAAEKIAETSRKNGSDLLDLPAWLGQTFDETGKRIGKGALPNAKPQRLDIVHGDLHFEVCLEFPTKLEIGAQIVGVFRDITQRSESVRLKQELVSTVSHELRSPLTAIKGAMGLVLAGSAGAIPDRVRGMIEIAHRNADRLILIINDILDLDKISDGAMLFDNVDTNLSAEISSAIELVAGFSDRFGVNVEVGALDTALVSFVDPNRLVQVLVNLLSNAIKFSSAGGTVTVNLARHADFNRITVVDAGEGIPENEQKLLFERFVQVGVKNRAAPGGTGLGLSIVRAIVEKQGGRISFESTLGLGTKFHVDLPDLSYAHNDMQITGSETK